MLFLPGSPHSRRTRWNNDLPITIHCGTVSTRFRFRRSNITQNRSTQNPTGLRGDTIWPSWATFSFTSLLTALLLVAGWLAPDRKPDTETRRDTRTHNHSPIPPFSLSAHNTAAACWIPPFFTLEGGEIFFHPNFFLSDANPQMHFSASSIDSGTTVGTISGKRDRL